jgi:hypothetical protein
MGSRTNWPRTPKPNPEVLEALEKALQAARSGHVTAATIVLVNPVHEVEHVTVGAVTGAIALSLIGGLAKAAHLIISDT